MEMEENYRKCKCGGIYIGSKLRETTENVN